MSHTLALYQCVIYYRLTHLYLCIACMCVHTHINLQMAYICKPQPCCISNPSSCKAGPGKEQAPKGHRKTRALRSNGFFSSASLRLGPCQVKCPKFPAAASSLALLVTSASRRALWVVEGCRGPHGSTQTGQEEPFHLQTGSNNANS